MGVLSVVQGPRWLKLLPRALALALVAGATVGAAPDANAGGFSNLDAGGRRAGMFAVTARPDDASAIFHNPAGLTLLEGTQFYHSQTWSFIDMGMRFYDSEGELRPSHNVEPDWNIGLLPFFGAVTDLYTKRLRVGLGIYAPNAYGASLPADEPTRYHVTKALFVAARTTGTVAYQLTDRLSVGLGLSAVYVYLRGERVMNPLVMDDPDRRFDPQAETEPYDSLLEMEGYDLTWGANAGLLFEVLPGFRLGAAFTRGAEVALEGDVTVRLPDESTQSTTHTTRMVIPFTLRGGFNWEIAPDVELGADIYYWHYQVYQEHRMTLDEPLLNISEIVTPKNYGNSWNWCVGMLYRPWPGLELMAGYQEDYTPIPEETFSLDTPLPDMKGVSLGARWQVTDSLRLGIAMVRNWYELIQVERSLTDPPTNAKGFGGNTELALDLTYRL